MKEVDTVTPEPAFQVVVSLHVGAGIEPESSGRAASVVRHWAISLALMQYYFQYHVWHIFTDPLNIRLYVTFGHNFKSTIAGG